MMLLRFSLKAFEAMVTLPSTLMRILNYVAPLSVLKLALRSLKTWRRDFGTKCVALWLSPLRVESGKVAEKSHVCRGHSVAVYGRHIFKCCFFVLDTTSK